VAARLRKLDFPVRFLKRETGGVSVASWGFRGSIVVLMCNVKSLSVGEDIVFRFVGSLIEEAEDL